ncbi:alpha/beta fold hydrolase [Methanosphaera sp. ISO3-F5]|uniref:alpha/beta hydrolase n=1 Tax=Methanosphaera sp. ISO3-F5 TaxID=1452353 RepID=UPI002B25C749|nr:alpha/beta fold hydrolase [Methanosphaera sp. ISO3-F5]WQH63972.1 alpha/beta fold hydrolase [Methanosphaera sp. ISO3-F5]
MILDKTYEINGQKIRGKLYLPEKKEKQKIIILSHGLSLNYTYMIPYAEKLYNKNIATFIFDYRGGGYDCHSDGKISDMTIDTEKEDLNHVINSIKQEPLIDENNVYLGGHSQGGLVSSLVAPTRNDIRGLFLFAPAYVIPDDMKERDNPREKNVLNLMPEYLGEKYINSALKINIFEDIKGYTGKVFIFHGVEDKRVPIEYIVKADKVYENSVVYIYEEGEHRFTDEIKNDVVDIISDNI